MEEIKVKDFEGRWSVNGGSRLTAREEALQKFSTWKAESNHTSVISIQSKTRLVDEWDFGGWERAYMFEVIYSDR